MSKLIQTLAYAWLGFLSTATLFYSLARINIEAHQLPLVLSPGHDAFGRDCISLTAFAIGQSARVVLPLSILCLACALAIAVATILLPRTYGQAARAITDACLALPGFLMALSLGVIFSQTRWVFVGGALIIAVPSLVKFFEGQLHSLAQKDFIHAARAMGANQTQLLKTHFFREILSMTASFLPFLFLRLTLLETSLSFLGLSAVPQHETWGRVLHQGKDYFLEAPWIFWTASTPLVFTLLSFHLLSRADES